MLLLALSLLPALADEPTLTVETFNAGLAHGFVDHAKARRPYIIDALSRTDADVVCLQEVWESSDRRAIERALQDAYPHRLVPPVVVQRADHAPACKRGELFGEGRFVNCMSTRCGDLSGDAKTDCIIARCDNELDQLRQENPDCAQALFAQVGRSSLSAVLALLSPFRAAKTYAYDGSTGLMLLSRRPLAGSGVLDFTDIATLNRRSALWADVDVDGGPVRVYCAHLTADLEGIAPYPGSFADWGAENRAQVDRLLDHAGDHGGPVVLTGDFNCGLPDATAGLDPEIPDSCQAIVDAGYTDAASLLSEPVCTWCGENLLNAEEGDTKNALLDHLFLRGLAPTTQGRRYDQAVQVDTGKQTQPLHLSDHFGYGAALALKTLDLHTPAVEVDEVMEPLDPDVSPDPVPEAP